MIIVAAENQQVLNIMSVCIALVIWHVRRMRRSILSSVAYLVLPYFSTRIIFEKKKVTVYEMCVLIFSTNFI
jgi:hypothetical protein